MQTNLGGIKKRVALLTRGMQGPGATLGVFWEEISGGTVDPVTSAVVDGISTMLSGTMRGTVHQTEAKTTLRQYAEIQAGDLIVDLDPDQGVTLPNGQSVSGTVALDSLAKKGVKFLVDGQYFVQKELGEGLTQAWNVVAGDQRLVRTILLRKAT